jgi:pimeloyl-ACP methyl ester carboxylesterase
LEITMDQESHDRRPVGGREVSLDGVRVVTLGDARDLAFEEWGDPDGFPAFYFHGTPGSRLEGAFADSAAGRHGFRLIAVDRPGFGRSTFQVGRAFRDWPGDVCALADALGVREFGVVGHSGGGPHLFACGAYVRTDRLRFVGALGPWGPVATPEIGASLNALDRSYSWVARRTPWVMHASFAPLGWCARYWPWLLYGLTRTAVSSGDRTALREGGLLTVLRPSEREAFRQGSRGGAHEALMAYRDWDFDISTVRVSTHIWLGDEDIFVSREMGRYLERTIPGVDFHWLDGRGHFDMSAWDDILAACARHV